MTATADDPATGDPRPAYDGGRTIALKVPPHQWPDTVAFYRHVLGLGELHDLEVAGSTAVFAFGPNRLWIDRVPSMSQCELWLEVTTSDTVTAAAHLASAGVTRCDEVEPLPDDTAFWVTSPAAVEHLVAQSAATDRDDRRRRGPLTASTSARTCS